MAKSAKQASPQRKPGFIERFLRWVFRTLFRVTWWVGIRVAIVGGLVLGGATAYYYFKLPPMETLLDGRAGGSVTMLDHRGKVFAWRGQQFDGSLRAETVSPVLRNAVIATEDKRFYRHFGISPRGIAGAIRINLSEGRGPLEGHGGSTITQQVAKLLCLGEDGTEAECRRQSLARKIKEVPFSMAMELKYDKNGILSIYLNRAYLGAGAHGFEAAAQRYFNKSARDVTAAEAAMLAGLLTAPTRYAPTTNLERSQARAETVVGLMETQGYLTRVEADIARANPATLSSAARDLAGEAFADWVMQDAPDYLTRNTTEDVAFLTTFDARIQKAAESALEHVFATKVREGSKAQAAIVVMSPDGAVRAIVGGRDIDAGPGSFNRATQAMRQTGSSFKPFVYAAALESGMNPLDIVVDEPITINVPGSGPYSPKNYTREFRGPITLTEALAQSVNTVAVRVSEQVGRGRVQAVAQDFGIDSPLAAGPALALGASESTLIEMTGAYAGFLNGGRRTSPYGWLDLRLRGDDQVLMSADREQGYRVINERAAGHLVYMLNQVVETGTGGRARLPDGRPAAGKTGTTQGARDAWFIGFTGDYVTGVWMGYDDNSKLTGVTGGGLPAEIWRETMVRVHEGLPPRPLPLIVPEPPRQGLDDLFTVNIDGASIDEKVESVAKTIFEDVLNGLLGRNTN
ncbi:transglycosylase domain-containing protein [Oceanomicrobium pacificus]|uniref:peptidoglycan glycosyltransferase n=1 Tax=Oceanomicrobium pacificus TaxID=2692916 RepID=A0A6B0TUF0_9RHOB|nr:PBP1A family penicillin-binding protein [Oceanomicrobium pacificus]MXU64872.1 PBP1A family penicillin-binding protein [Oceanomicrobium pacificus]